jgi:hypothetical protein
VTVPMKAVTAELKLHNLKLLPAHSTRYLVDKRDLYLYLFYLFLALMPTHAASALTRTATLSNGAWPVGPM